jgi:hypothetical protein
MRGARYALFVERSQADAVLGRRWLDGAFRTLKAMGRRRRGVCRQRRPCIGRLVCVSRHQALALQRCDFEETTGMLY